MTNTLTDAAGVRNATGQGTLAIAEVVLVYFPVLVLVSSTTRKLKKTNRKCVKTQNKWGILKITLIDAFILK